MFQLGSEIKNTEIMDILKFFMKKLNNALQTCSQKIMIG